MPIEEHEILFAEYLSTERQNGISWFSFLENVAGDRKNLLIRCKIACLSSVSVIRDVQLQV